MCGIVGYVESGRPSHNDVLMRMTSQLTHRGPDGSGCSFKQIAGCNVAIGHTRLSIIDLSSLGDQPMEFDGLTIAFNGEIYNYREIRKELISLGYQFDSECDTEVALKALHCWGWEGTQKFNGMFAIALANESDGTITLLRDRNGVKPLYWYYKGGVLLFASELKSIHEYPLFEKSLNLNSVWQYFTYGYIPEPASIFEHVHKLEAGSCLILNCGTGEIEQNRYWDIRDAFRADKATASEAEASERLHELMTSSCSYRLIADVPVGIFLSGGYDSTYVTAVSQQISSTRLKTFTIGFDNESFNEAHHARDIADFLGTDHTELYCTDADLIEILLQVPRIWDEPISDKSILPTALVSRLASESVKVAMSADGGDEAFAGYEKYARSLQMNAATLTRRLVSRSISALLPVGLDWAISKTLPPSARRRIHYASELVEAATPLEYMHIMQKLFSNPDMRRLLPGVDATAGLELSNSFCKNSMTAIDSMLCSDARTYQLDNILPKVDRATMYFGLEGREPLLDYRITEFAATLPEDLKYKDGQLKYLLKKNCHDLVPRKILDRPKKGFGFPVEDFLKKNMKSKIQELFSPARIKEQGIFDPKETQYLSSSFLSGSGRLTQQVWSMMIFQLWYEQWM